jgi:chromosome segregation ATPase
MSDSESASQADITPEQALDNLIFPEHEPNLEAVRCPECAEKDAEIARLNALVETEIKCRSDLVSELAWIKSERPAIAKTERDLRKQLETAKGALKTIRDALRGNERMPHVVAKEALKEIGE